jgi:hypothetical protein
MEAIYPGHSSWTTGLQYRRRKLHRRRRRGVAWRTVTALPCLLQQRSLSALSCVWGGRLLQLRNISLLAELVQTNSTAFYKYLAPNGAKTLSGKPTLLGQECSKVPAPLGATVYSSNILHSALSSVRSGTFLRINSAPLAAEPFELLPLPKNTPRATHLKSETKKTRQLLKRSRGTIRS